MWGKEGIQTEIKLLNLKLWCCIEMHVQIFQGLSITSLIPWRNLFIKIFRRHLWMPTGLYYSAGQNSQTLFPLREVVRVRRKTCRHCLNLCTWVLRIFALAICKLELLLFYPPSYCSIFFFYSLPRSKQARSLSNPSLGIRYFAFFHILAIGDLLMQCLAFASFWGIISRPLFLPACLPLVLTLSWSLEPRLHIDAHFF